MELSVLDGCILWGSRVVIPSVFRQSLLQELHTNLGMSRMKSLARSYVWWPGLDSQIEEVCRPCVECCAANRNSPKAPAHPWMIPQYPWQRVHVDHAYFGQHLLLVVVDAYSKWLEVHIVSLTSAQQTIDKLRQIQYSSSLTLHSHVKTRVLSPAFCVELLNISRVFDFYLQFWHVCACIFLKNICACMNTHFTSTLKTAQVHSHSRNTSRVYFVMHLTCTCTRHRHAW